jgi:rare lipoprotein A
MFKRQPFIVIILCFVALLTSCSHMKRKDGPPNFYVDESKIPDAVPRPEPLAKYGNMPSYRVFGKRYYTMKSSKHYSQIGTASWYGTQFHSHRASSGERYNMLDMTAAHRTLPLPTYVQVTNLRNNRKVIVKVNDRGPFVNDHERIIDVSYVAAKKLGMIGHGTARVRVTAIDPYTFGKQQLYFNADKPFYLQVGAFRNKSNAEKHKQHLTALLNTQVNIAKPFSSKLYHVQIGPINDPGKAKKIANRLRELGIKSNKRYGV